MSIRRRNDHLGDAELLAMTSELDQMHRDQALPAMRGAVAELVESFKGGPSGTSAHHTHRRTFLLGAAGVGAGTALLAACGSSSSTSSATTTVPASSSSSSAPATTTAPAASSSGHLTGDLAVAAMAASLENLGVFAYKAGLTAAKAGKLGKVPPAVATFAETAMAQHIDHAKAWNSALVGAGKKAVTATDPKLTPVVEASFAKVKNVTDLAELALLIENIAAQTYQGAIPALKASSSIAVAATIQPVEMQHAAILYYVLGRYPGIQGTTGNSYGTGTPLAFNPTALARPASDYTGS